jgi:hypothetical protein
MQYQNEKKLGKIPPQILQLNVARNTHKRFNCFQCGGKNTLSVTNDGGYLKWHCFKASCVINGNQRQEMSLDSMRELNKLEENSSPVNISKFTDWTQNIKAYPSVMEYLGKNNCLEAYEAYPLRFFYDVRQNRVVFVEYFGLNEVKFATGRALDNSKPKWYKYCSLPGEYFYAPSKNASKTIAIVEDCASACSISRVIPALALCGTSWSTALLARRLHNEKYGEIRICLDKDAFEKALKLKQDLSAFSNVKLINVCNLSDDGKYLSKTQLEKELNYGND